MIDPLVSVATRILAATVQRVDRIAETLAERRPGEVVRRSDALRIALERGVESVERELGITSEEPTKPLPKGGKPPRKAK